MAVTYSFPTNVELDQIDQTLLAQTTMDDPIFDLFPIRQVDADLLIWEQRDNYLGLQQIRGMNGEPPVVKRIGGKRYQMTPGYYGEWINIDEAELTRRRPWGRFNGTISIEDLVTEAQEQLVTREVSRMRKTIWDLLVYGIFTVMDAKGAILQQDSYKQTLFSSAVAWSSSTTATPLSDLRQVQLLHRGYSVSFGANAMAFANQQTVNYMLNNNNPVDLYGRRTMGLGTYNNLKQDNELLAGDGLPTIIPYDDGYLDDNGAFQLLIPDNYVVVIGKRTNNAKVGEYRLTKNLNNLMGGSAPYNRVFDRGETQVPRKIEVHRGQSGGPVIYFPSAIVAMKVG